jgi:hypothetical protein
MAITTYAELQTAIGSWLDRSLTQVTDFIVLFEAQVNRRLMVRQQTTSTTLTPSSGSATLPTDYLEWKRVTWTGSPTRELTYVTPSALSSFNASAVSGTPTHFTIEGSTLKVAEISDTALDFLYSQKVPALSVTNTTNWLLTAHPDAYLFGALTMSATLTSDAENGRAWNALTQGILGELWGLDFSQRGTTVQRTTGPTP